MTSLIMTVLNEVEHLPAWFESISKQTKMPDEIVIVDGGSKDGTYEFLETAQTAFPNLKVYRDSGNIAYGRNRAVEKASGEILVATDAGCTYAADWFEKITTPILSRECEWAATGFGPWLEKQDSILLYAIAAATTPRPEEFKKNWLPSSRSVAFRRELWLAVQGYPEWIPFCEDVIFDKNILKTGRLPALVREPLVFWKPRPTLQKFCRQLYNYTRSEGHGKLNTNRQLIRYAVYFLALVLLAFGFIINYFFWLALLLGVVVYMPKFWLRWLTFTRQKGLLFSFLGLLVVPIVVAVGDFAKMTGYKIGVYERLSGRIKAPKL